MLKVRCFKTTGDNRPFLSKFDVKLGSWGIIHTGEQSFRSFDQALTSPSGVQRRIYTTSAEREFDGTEDQKCPSNFFILCEYIGNVYTYI
jgi:hypothetical protein